MISEKIERQTIKEALKAITALIAIGRFKFERKPLT
jgi:hypothetical protein